MLAGGLRTEEMHATDAGAQFVLIGLEFLDHHFLGQHIVFEHRCVVIYIVSLLHVAIYY
jgi:hypothetical protein